MKFLHMVLPSNMVDYRKLYTFMKELKRKLTSTLALIPLGPSLKYEMCYDTSN